MLRPGRAEAESEDAAVVSMKLIGASATADIVGLEPLPGVSHYLVGSDPTRWHTLQVAQHCASCCDFGISLLQPSCSLFAIIFSQQSAFSGAGACAARGTTAHASENTSAR